MATIDVCWAWLAGRLPDHRPSRAELHLAALHHRAQQSIEPQQLIVLLNR